MGTLAPDNRFEGGLGYTYVFSPTFVMSLTAGWGRWVEGRVPQGVPSEMIKGNQPPEATPPPQSAAATPPPAEKPKPKKKVQAKPKAPPSATPGPSAQTVPPAASTVPLLVIAMPFGLTR